MSGRELAARLDVDVRTVRRDIARLRGMGYRVDAGPGPHGAYELRANSTMPPLMLSDEEAVALVVAGMALATARSGLIGTGKNAPVEDPAQTRARQADAGDTAPAGINLPARHRGPDHLA